MKSVLLASLAVLGRSCQIGQYLLSDDSPTRYTPFSSEFDFFVEELLREWHVFGLAIAVVHANETWSKGYGYAVLPDEPVTPHTLFQGASTTKSFTASLAALLVDDNDAFKTVQWSSSMHDLLGTEFVLADKDLTQHVTVQDALSHRTGIPRHDAAWVNNDIDVEGEVHALRYLPASAPLRTKFQYCNLMFTAVSHLIQIVTHKWHGNVLREWLWDPLGMNQSYYSYADAHKCRLTDARCKMATGYAWNNVSQKYHAIPDSAYHAGNGAGGIISNVLDYSKWLRALIYEDGPVPAAGHSAIKSPMSVAAADQYPYSGPLWYGLGLEGGVYRSHKVHGHSGAIGGYWSRFAVVPDKQWGFIAFQNASGRVTDVVQWRLIDEMLKVPVGEHAAMNEHLLKKEAEELESRRTLPSKLYSTTPSQPIPPSLSLTYYEGSYRHAGYGHINLTLTAPVSDVVHSSPIKGATDAALYAMGRCEESLYTLRHASGEHWLLEMRYHVHNTQVVDGYTKARFEIGSSGAVGRLGVMWDASEQEEDEGWVWFHKSRQ
ncbi:hypothetical protein AAFC00_002154 [Neodothiora populina]